MPGVAGWGAPLDEADEPLPDTAPAEAPEVLGAVVVGEPAERAPPALLEAAVVWFGWTRNYDAVTHFHKLTEELRIEVVPFTSQMSELAFQAYRTYGEGISPPGLNLGDCAVWATARQHGMRVLHVGEEFTHADIGV